MFKSLRVKLARRFKRMSASSDIDSNANHRTAASIFRLALRDPEVEMLLRPVENKRIVKLESREVYITLQKTLLEISNHKFSYSLEIPYEMFLKLSKLFDIKLDALIEKEENNIISQVHTGLSMVLETFKTK